MCYTYFNKSQEASSLSFLGLMILLYLPITFFLAMTIFIIFRAIRFGVEYELFTNATVGVGIFSAVVLYVYAFINYKGVIREFILPTLCLILALFIKKIIRCFMDYFDRTHQISVSPDDALYRFEFKQNSSDDFLDEDSRFNGKFKNFDDIDN